MSTDVLLIPATDLDQVRMDPSAGAAPVVVVLLDGGVAPTSVAALEWLASPARLTMAWLGPVTVQAQLSIAMACDVVVADSSAQLAFSAAPDAALPIEGAIDRLIDRTGRSRALALMVSGAIEAQQAFEWGLVDRIGPREFAVNWADEIAQHSREWIAEVKALLVQAGPTVSTERVRRREEEALARLFSQDP